MKYLLIITWVIYIITISFFLYFLSEKKQNNNKIEESIVIIKAENELINYNINPKWIFDDYKNYWIWAWFFIDWNWLIQTVNHIIENENINYKVFYNNKEYDSQIISRDKINDLAKIKINIKNNKYLKFWEKININEKIISYWINTKNNKIIYNSWIIINKKIKLENYSNLIEISNPIKSGFSGWPILNSKNEVIWINFATFKDKSYWISFIN